MIKKLLLIIVLLKFFSLVNAEELNLNNQSTSPAVEAYSNHDDFSKIDTSLINVSAWSYILFDSLIEPLFYIFSKSSG